MHTRFWLGRKKERKHLEALEIQVMLMLKWRNMGLVCVSLVLW